MTGRPAPFATSYMIGWENERTNNRTMIPALRNNAAAGYQGPVKTKLLKCADLLTMIRFKPPFQATKRDKPNAFTHTGYSKQKTCGCNFSVLVSDLLLTKPVIRFYFSLITTKRAFKRKLHKLLLTVLGIEDYYVDAHSLILKFNANNYCTL